MLSYTQHCHVFLSDKPQWDFMNGLMENAIYGGRVDNSFDMRVLRSYLQQCFTEAVVTGQVCVCVCACVRAYVRACVRACVRAWGRPGGLVVRTSVLGH